MKAFIMRTTLFIVLLTATSLLGGCATSPWGEATSGGAVYRYEKTQEGCTLTMTTARDVAAGGDVLIDDCNVTVTVEGMSGSNTALAVIQSLVHQLIMVTGADK